MDFATITKIGEKDYNSDRIATFTDDESSCFVIADGHETPDAAELSVNSVIEDFKKSKVITKSSVSDFFNNAGELLNSQEVPVSTCLSFLLTNGSVAVWGNIGDCRIYLLRDNWLYEITPDHSSAYALYEAGEIRYPKIRRQKTRYDLTRVLGKDKEINPDSSQPEMIRPGDSFLICTDGFWSNIHERQIEKTLKRSNSAQNWLDRMTSIVDKNIHYKKYSRFRDSYSAITIKI